MSRDAKRVSARVLSRVRMQARTLLRPFDNLGDLPAPTVLLFGGSEVCTASR